MLQTGFDYGQFCVNRLYKKILIQTRINEAKNHRENCCLRYLHFCIAEMDVDWGNFYNLKRIEKFTAKDKYPKMLIN